MFLTVRARRRDRAHSGRPSTYVANWPAVADTLRGSPFAALVDNADDPAAAGQVVASQQPPPPGAAPARAPLRPAASFFFLSGVLVGAGVARGWRAGR